MLRVGLTGGIGSGKSEVSRRLAALGAVILDADQAARAVVAPGTPGLARIVAAFGENILRPDGSLDRERLGAIVFSDQEKLATLNGIVHPLVGELMSQQERAAGDEAVVVHDVPLLAENGLEGGFDLVVVVDAAEESQEDRLTRLRGMPEDQARARMAAQASREKRRGVADIVIENDGSLEDLDRRVADLWERLRNVRPPA